MKLKHRTNTHFIHSFTHSPHRIRSHTFIYVSIHICFKQLSLDFGSLIFHHQTLMTIQSNIQWNGKSRFTLIRQPFSRCSLVSHARTHTRTYTICCKCMQIFKNESLKIAQYMKSNIFCFFAWFYVRCGIWKVLGKVTKQFKIDTAVVQQSFARKRSFIHSNRFIVCVYNFKVKLHWFSLIFFPLPLTQFHPFHSK